MTQKAWQLGLLGVTFITAQYMLYITHCANVTLEKCKTINDTFCVLDHNRTLRNGYEILSPPPNCTKRVCNVSLQAFAVTGCPPDPNDRLLKLPFRRVDNFWPICCNISNLTLVD
uniref:Putative 8.9 kDa family member n=1 Tax=Rhipicephalus pulchellus TaxID=72859 RepID=L7M9U4_RHIPC